MAKLTFFMHTHKCAGTSLIHLYAQDDAFKLCNGWRRNGGMPPYFRKLKQLETYEQRDKVCNKKRLQRVFTGFEERQINFIATEWLVPTEESLPFGRDYFYFTVLRDPFARYLSNYHFDDESGYRRVPSIYDYRDSSIFRTYNYYTRFLGSRLNQDDSPVTTGDYERALGMLERLDAIVILEQPETFELLTPSGVDLSKLGRRNTSKRAAKEYPEGFKEHFMQQAKWDYMLYDEAKRLAESRLALR